MGRRTTCFLTVSVFLFAVLTLIPHRASSNSNVVRLTKTLEQAVNLNPSLSDDGRTVVFESSANFFAAGLNDSFHAMRADVGGDPPTFVDIGATRIIAPAISRDGSAVTFASTEDLVGKNADRNSEIFLISGSGLKQITGTLPNSSVTRLEDGNSQPSMTADGSLIAFTSRGNLLLFDTRNNNLTQLAEGAFSPKISGDGSCVYFQRADDLVLLELKTRQTRIVAANVPKLAIGLGRGVSNDGTRLVYSAETAENQSQVFLFDDRDGQARQITQLGSRSVDVNLQPTISGDGKRVAFATRRRVTNTSDGSVELYVYDVPSGQTQQVTNAPPSATAEVVSSLNLDGSRVAFSFPRVLSGPVAEDFDNNSEIYVASVLPRPPFGTATVLNAATFEPGSVAPGSIAVVSGSLLAFRTERAISTDLAFVLAGTNVKVKGRPAPIVYASPDEVVFVVPDGLADGPAEFVVTNADGFSSKAEAMISPAAPGVFTVNGDGRGEAIALNSDTQVAAPFDPTVGRTRLSIFATGISHAHDVSVAINGQPVKVETVAHSGLLGLDEIHVLIPAELRGAGVSTLAVTADGVQSNSTTITIGGSSLRDIVINEFLADPADGLAGDANHDGVRDTAADEFIELVNSTPHDLDLSGYQLQTRALTASNDIPRHRFATGTILFAGTAIVVFGGGSPNAANPIFGGSLVVKASSGGLSLVNSGGVITLRNTAGEIVTSVAYGSSLSLRADQNQSLTRSPDITGAFVPHSTASGSEGRLFSPGTHLDGSAFIRVSNPTPTPTPIPSPTPTPIPSPSPSPTATPIPTPTPLPTPTAAPQTIVITQLFGGGGNTNAPYRNDFIELFNNSHSPTNLAGWSIQYASATATTWSVTPLTPITLAPGQYYLVQQASGGANGISLPQPDASGTIAMAATAGKVALVKTTTALAGSCPNDPNIVDLVGYGITATCFKGAAPAPAASNTTSVLRKSNGCTDTQNNNADFTTANPNPRNLVSPVNICAELTAGFDIFKFLHGLSHRRDHAAAPAFWFRQLPRRPT
ncbi:MAG TPA: lamin tail domain-containing protein [Pyrinomonadaceae bacterium]|nr:lamin tail domain-containing protein [Pyrinomonadaceae bacterium]